MEYTKDLVIFLLGNLLVDLGITSNVSYSICVVPYFQLPSVRDRFLLKFESGHQISPRYGSAEMDLQPQEPVKTTGSCGPPVFGNFKKWASLILYVLQYSCPIVFRF